MQRKSALKSIVFHGLIGIFLLQSCSIFEKRPTSLETGRNALNERYCMPELLDKTWYYSRKKAPLFSGLGDIYFPITTKSAESQLYFDQGMMLSYGFNHAEAARSFYEAARQDTTCAMCWWGYAYVLGPNYNGGMEPDNLLRAYDAIHKAERLSAGCTQKEKDLIKALTYRYSNDPSMARSMLDSSYASRMRIVSAKYPKDPDINGLFAESLMDLHPWDLFRRNGLAEPWTSEIIAILEKSLKIAPRHAGLNHFYIHVMEMSPNADKALPSARILGDLAPGSGHLVHMPSHAYVRTGNYHEGALANLKALEVDSQYNEACHAFGVYPLAYYPHNYHFLTACSTLDGESRNAMFAAKATKAHAYEKLILDPYWTTLQHFYSMPLFVAVKLGKWDEIKKTPQPEKELIYPGVIWHYAQGMAALAENKPIKARKHLVYMKSAMKDTTLKILTIWGKNHLYDICMIASETLEGEINAKYGEYTNAIKFLKSAIAREDKLRYQEPPDWFFSVRHNLGAVLIACGNFRGAISVYNEDLKKYPENGWALVGLMNAYKKMGKQSDYQNFRDRFEMAWKNADFHINSSRIL